MPPISISAARAIVDAAVRVLPAEDVPVAEALGRVLAEDLRAAGDVPGFRSSAMDGFAVTAGGAGRTLRIAGEARAGAPSDAGPGPDEAIRISTGAVVPAGAEAVVRLEDADELDGLVTVRVAAAAGANIREAGEDLRAGEVVLRAGTRLGPGELGVAVGAGAGAAPCARRPRVTVLATGDELVAAGAPLGPGQIHNSNAVVLAALAHAAGAVVTEAATVPDDAAGTEAALARAAGVADVLVVSGGVSVGPHDHVKPALAALGVEERFWRVALKPGAPTWFGAADGLVAFGLPGNPVSAYVTFALFARRALLALQGAPPHPRVVRAALGEPVRLSPDREQALRVRLEPTDGAPLARTTGPQGSHVTSSLVGADGLAIVPPGDGRLEAGALVPVELL